jgi:hypothetical protein
VVKNLTKRGNSRENRFPKTLFALSHCSIVEDDDFRDLLSRSQMHVDERDEVASAAQQQKRWNLDVLVFFVVVRIATIVAATHIYREDMSRVIVSHNRICLSLSKCIRHGHVAKLNSKRRPWTCEALD